MSGFFVNNADKVAKRLGLSLLFGGVLLLATVPLIVAGAVVFGAVIT